MIKEIKFWKKHLDWFIPFISELYPLSKFQLLQHDDILDWNRIAINQFIKWDKESSDYFHHKIASAEVIKPKVIGYKVNEDHCTIRNVNLIDWVPEYHEALDNNDEIKSKEIWKQIHFGYYKIPEYGEDMLTMLIDKFDCEINYDDNPIERLPIPTKLVKEDIESIDWHKLSDYWGIWWSFELLQQFDDYWITEKLITNQTAFNYCLKDDLDDKFIKNVLDSI